MKHLMIALTLLASTANASEYDVYQGLCGAYLIASQAPVERVERFMATYPATPTARRVAIDFAQSDKPQGELIVAGQLACAALNFDWRSQ